MSECGQYRNPERGRQLILFDGLQYGDMSPTDIDGILDGKNRIWLVFEAKLADAPMRRGQRLTLERVLQVKGVASVAWSLRSDVETSSVSNTMLKQTSVNGKEDAEVTSELTQRIRQRVRSAMPPVKPIFEPLFGDTCIYREHPLFPGSKMAIYACELDGEFQEYKY